MSRFVCLLTVFAVANVSTADVSAQESALVDLSPAQLFQETSPAIVRVFRFDAQGRQTGQGTGFFISDDGLLATNHHVIKDGTFWRVAFGDDRVLDVVGVVASSARADVAILQVNGRWLPYLDLGSNNLPNPGEKVLAIGNPLGSRIPLATAY